MVLDTRPLVVRAGDAERLGDDRGMIRLLADGDPGDPRSLSAVRSSLGRDTDGPPPHRHRTAPESFFILDGRLHVLLGTEIVLLHAGDFLMVPPGTPHAFATPADTGVDMLFLMPGVGRFDYFRLADRVRSGGVPPSELLATQERFDNHFQDSPEWRAFRAAARRPGGGA